MRETMNILYSVRCYSTRIFPEDEGRYGSDCYGNLICRASDTIMTDIFFGYWGFIPYYAEKQSGTYVLHERRIENGVCPR